MTIAAMHGRAATRCPAWHCDHVPVRSIRTLHGPGTLYIDPSEYSYENDKGLQCMVRNEPPEEMNDPDIDTRESPSVWKDRCLQEYSTATASQATAGEIVFLIGRQWAQISKQEALDAFHDNTCAAILHRSPRNVAKDQGRVIMTIDVLLEEEENQCAHGCACKRDE